MEKLNPKLDILSDENVLKEMEEAFYNCPTAVKYITKKLGISEEEIKANITKIYNFVLDINYCEHCPGVKACQKHNPYLCTNITYNNGIVDRVITPCKKMLQQIEFENQFKVRDFDEEWLTHSIKNLDNKAGKGRGKALKKYTDYKTGKSDEWIYLVGSTNSGKSYLASQICVDMAKGKLGPICFIDSSKRFKELLDMSYKVKDKFEEELHLYSSCPVLVIDDFGNGFYNDYIRDGILFTIISNRAKKRLFTIFTSSYTYDEIITILANNKAGELKIRQIMDTIRHMSKEEVSLGDLAIY